MTSLERVRWLLFTGEDSMGVKIATTVFYVEVLFEREARLLLSCDHENVVRALGFDETLKALCLGLY